MMFPQPTPPAPLPPVQEFSPPHGLGVAVRMMWPLSPLFVMFFLVMMGLGAIFTSSTPLGVVVGAVSTVLLALVPYRKITRLRTVLRFDGEGVMLTDNKGFRVVLPWRDMTQVGPVNTRMVSPRPVGRPWGMKARAGATSSLGLIGWGERATPARVPGWMRDELARQPVEPGTGRPLVAIPLGAIDPGWTLGDMGRWVHAHRPDLMSQAQES
ncbi:MAG: hypothetical protein GEV11_14090 [Streptosporangiales bacterium]|nr:hypothetical protein [Streptosporangiales bacterium]